MRVFVNAKQTEGGMVYDGKVRVHKPPVAPEPLKIGGTYGGGVSIYLTAEEVRDVVAEARRQGIAPVTGTEVVAAVRPISAPEVSAIKKEMARTLTLRLGPPDPLAADRALVAEANARFAAFCERADKINAARLRIKAANREAERLTAAFEGAY